MCGGQPIIQSAITQSQLPLKNGTVVFLKENVSRIGSVVECLHESGTSEEARMYVVSWGEGHTMTSSHRESDLEEFYAGNWMVDDTPIRLSGHFVIYPGQGISFFAYFERKSIDLFLDNDDDAKRSRGTVVDWMTIRWDDGFTWYRAKRDVLAIVRQASHAFGKHLDEKERDMDQLRRNIQVQKNNLESYKEHTRAAREKEKEKDHIYASTSVVKLQSELDRVLQDNDRLRTIFDQLSRKNDDNAENRSLIAKFVADVEIAEAKKTNGGIVQKRQISRKWHPDQHHSQSKEVSNFANEVMAIINDLA